MADEPVITQFASQLKFNLLISRCPNVTWHIQTVNIPGITTGRAPEGTPFVKLFHLGDHIEYGLLEVSFKIDEKFNNWFEVYSWLEGIGFPRKHQERANLKKSDIKNLDGTPVVPPRHKETHRKFGDIFSQITLSVLTSHNNPIVEIQFYDAWPVGISPLQLTSTDEDVKYLTANASFSYTYYSVIRP